MRKVIITDVQTSPGAFRVVAFLWLTLPGKRVLGRPGVSRLPDQSDTVPWGLSPEERGIFSKGFLVEKAVTCGPFASEATAEEVKAQLLLTHNAEQAQIDAAGAGSLDLVGVSYDGAEWSVTAAK